MARWFYFDLVSENRTVKDDEGVEADSLEQAVTEARRVISEMQACNDLPHDADAWQIQIRDDDGFVLRSIRLG